METETRLAAYIPARLAVGRVYRGRLLTGFYADRLPSYWRVRLEWSTMFARDGFPRMGLCDRVRLLWFYLHSTKGVVDE